MDKTTILPAAGHSNAASTLMKVGDVAKRLNCSVSLVYDHIASGRLRCYRIGKGRGGLRISEEQIQQFLLSREQGDTETTKAMPTCRPKVNELRHLHLD